MPVLPRRLTEFLDAPVPFIAGCDPSFIAMREPTEEVRGNRWIFIPPLALHMCLCLCSSTH